MTPGPSPTTTTPGWETFGVELDPNGQQSSRAQPSADDPEIPAQPPVDVLDVKRLIDHAALFVAPTSFVTGLMYWIGWAKTEAYWSHFGIDPALLKLSTTDYLVRAVSTSFTFLTLLLLFAITATMLYRAAEHHRTHLQPFQLQLLEWGLFAAGVLFFARIALADLFPSQLGALDWAHWASRGTLVGPVFGVIGLLMVAYSAQLHGNRLTMLHRHDTAQLGRSRRVLAGSSVAFIVLASFLAADRYAQYKGTQSAEADLGNPKYFYKTEIYSRDKLQISGIGLAEVPLAPSENSEQEKNFRFKYSGLRLMRYSRGNYFLLSLDDSRALVLPESADVRVEFLPSSIEEVPR
jgi:hypothetical protein